MKFVMKILFKKKNTIKNCCEKKMMAVIKKCINLSNFNIYGEFTNILRTNQCNAGVSESLWKCLWRTLYRQNIHFMALSVAMPCQIKRGRIDMPKKKKKLNISKFVISYKLLKNIPTITINWQTQELVLSK